MSAIFSGEQKLKRTPHGPVRGTIGFFDIVIGFKLGVHFLVADGKHFTQTTTQRYGPAIAGICLPVGGNDHIGDQVPAVIQVIIDKGFQEQLTDTRAIRIIRQKTRAAGPGGRWSMAWVG